MVAPAVLSQGPTAVLFPILFFSPLCRLEETLEAGVHALFPGGHPHLPKPTYTEGLLTAAAAATVWFLWLLSAFGVQGSRKLLLSKPALAAALLGGLTVYLFPTLEHAVEFLVTKGESGLQHAPAAWLRGGAAAAAARS